MLGPSQGRLKTFSILNESLLMLLVVHLVQFMMAYVSVQGPPGNEGPSGPRGPSGSMVCNVEAFEYLMSVRLSRQLKYRQYSTCITFPVLP